MGKPPKQQVQQMPPLRPAGFNFAQDFFKYVMPVLMQSQLPKFPGFTFHGKPWGAGHPYPTPQPMNAGIAQGMVEAPKPGQPPMQAQPGMQFN